MQNLKSRCSLALALFVAFTCVGPLLPAQTRGSDENEPALRGYICGPDGKPVPGASMLVNMYLKAEVDGDGRFAISPTQLSPGPGPVFILVQADQEGKELRCARFVDFVTGQENVTLRLEEAATAQGQVVSSEGEPIAGATIIPFINVGELTCHGTSPLRVSAKTDERGNFTLRGLYPTTRYMLRVRAEGFERKWTGWIPVGRRLLAPSLRIVLRDAPGSVAGRVVDAEKQPVVNARVILGHPCIPDAVCVTDRDGQFKFDDLVPGDKVQLWAARKPIRDVPVGTDDLVILEGEGEERERQ